MNGGPDRNLIPQQATGDDDAQWGEYPDEDADDERLIREIPPHHGG